MMPNAKICGGHQGVWWCHLAALQSRFGNLVGRSQELDLNQVA
jgi:hypothetical protein